MSHWKTWQQNVDTTRRNLFLQQTGIVNRNYHVLHELMKRPEINKILSVDLIPFTKKRSLRVWYESIFGKVPGNNVSHKFEVNRRRAKVTKVGERMWVYSTSRNLLEKNNPEDIWHELLAVSDELEFKNRLIWSYFPMYGLPFAKKGKTKVFDAVDDWREHPYCQAWKKFLDNNYQAIDQNANAIFTVSEAVKKLFPTNQNVHWIPNGIDFDHYQKPGMNLVSRLKDIKKPIIGYLGIIESRLDFDLLNKLADTYPQASLVLAGPVWKQAQVEKLKFKPNVNFIGSVAYHDLPELYNSFTVGIIPHKVTQFTKSMNPLKMYEYLASGLPVVTTPVAGIEQFAKFVTTASSTDDFVAAVGEHLKERQTDEIKERRRNAVRNHTWHSRLDKMFSLIPNA